MNQHLNWIAAALPSETNTNEISSNNCLFSRTACSPCPTTLDSQLDSDFFFLIIFNLRSIKYNVSPLKCRICFFPTIFKPRVTKVLQNIKMHESEWGRENEGQVAQHNVNEPWKEKLFLSRQKTHDHNFWWFAYVLCVFSSCPFSEKAALNCCC